MRLLETITTADRELFAEGTRLFERQLAKRGKPRFHPGRAPASFICAFDQGVPGPGWFPPERAGECWHCWTEQTAWLEFHLQPAPRLAVSVETHHTLDTALYSQLEVWFNDRRLDTTVVPSPTSDQTVRITAIIVSPNVASAPAWNRLTFRLPRTIRPIDFLPNHPDCRALGIGISRVTVKPAVSPAT